MPWESSSREAEQPGHGWSQSGPYITCWAISWRLPPKRSASVTGPSGPSNTYSWSRATMGSLRRSALSASRERVYSFSLASSCRRASSHCSRDTTSGRLIGIPPVRDRFADTTNRSRGHSRSLEDGFIYKWTTVPWTAVDREDRGSYRDGYDHVASRAQSAMISAQR